MSNSKCVIQPTAQQEVLDDGDILSLIFTEFGDPTIRRAKGSNVPSTRHSLFQASLVSKLFSDLALNVLWRTMDSPLPLLSLLEHPRKAADSAIVPTEEGWARVQFYAKKIRTLVVNIIGPEPAKPNGVQPIRLQTLAPLISGLSSPAQQQQQPLLPSLTSLQVICRAPLTKPTDLENLFVWLGPSITTLKLRFAPGSIVSADVDTIMREVQNRCSGGGNSGSSIRRLEWLASVGSAVAGYCESFKALEHLSLMVPAGEPGAVVQQHPRVLEDLAGCVGLKSLDVGVYLDGPDPWGVASWSAIMDTILQEDSDDDDADGHGQDEGQGELQFQFNPVHFPALRRFTTTGYPGWLLQSLIQLSPTLPTVEHISLTRKWSEDYASIPHHWDFIVESLVGCSALRTLTFGSTGKGWFFSSHANIERRGTLDLTLLPEVLSPRCKDTLEEVSVRQPIHLYKGDGRALVEAFPRLERFRPPLGGALGRREMMDPCSLRMVGADGQAVLGYTERRQLEQQQTQAQAQIEGLPSDTTTTTTATGAAGQEAVGQQNQEGGHGAGAGCSCHGGGGGGQLSTSPSDLGFGLVESIYEFMRLQVNAATLRMTGYPIDISDMSFELPITVGTPVED